MKKRHLRDLYVKGTLHSVEDDTGESVDVYLKKLNTTENEEAVRRANAARATILAGAADNDSDIYLSALSDAMDATRETLVDYLIAEEAGKRRESVEAEISHNPEWSDNDLLQGLSDAWRGGLAEQYKEDPENPEAKSVFEKLKQFAEEVEAVMDGEIASLRRNWEEADIALLQRKAVDVLLKIKADLTWVEEYRKSELFLGVRDPDNIREQYFEDRRELDELETPVLLDLLRAYREFVTDPQEGKDSQGTPSS